MRRLALCCLLIAPALSAQTPADRDMIAAWDDSLQRLTDVSRLPQYQELASQAGGEARTLRQSLFRLRSAVLRNDRGDMDNGLENIARDATSHGNWPWPKFVLARTFFSFESRHLLPNQTAAVQMGESFSSAGWRQLREVFKLDPLFGPARTLAIATIVAAGDREQHDDALEILKILLADRYPNPDALLAWGRDLHRQKLYDSAMKVLQRAAFGGGDFGRISMERARLLISLQDSAGATSAYWDGLDRITPIGREAYRLDLQWILTPDSIAVFDKVSDAELKHWLRRFWTERDAAAANNNGARLLEQLRRWEFVLENYRSSEPWRRTMFERVEMTDFDPLQPCIGAPPTDLYELLGKQPTHPGDIRDRELLLDHRGVIYLRHGEPIARVGSPGTNMNAAVLADDVAATATATTAAIPATGGQTRAAAEADRKFANRESWVFFIDGAWRVMNFQGSQAVGTYAPTTLRSYLPLIADAYMGLAPYMKSYSIVAADIDMYHSRARNGMSSDPLQCQPKIQEMVATSRVDAKVATNTDSDSPPLLAPWNAMVHSFALGSPRESNGKALVTFAIKSDDEKIVWQSSGDGRFDYPINFRIIAYQVETDTWVQIDTLRHSVSPAILDKKAWIAGWFEVPIGGGTWQVSVLATQSTEKSGVYVLQRGITLDSTDKLSLSDLVTGRPGAQPWIAPDGKPFPLNPPGVWPTKQGLELYYELRGIPANTPYTTTIMVKNPDGKIPINLKLNDQSSGKIMALRKSIALSQLNQGDYELVVSVTAEGKTVQRSTAILIRKP